MEAPDGEPAPPERDKARAFEQLTQVGRLLDAGRPDEGAAAAQRLLSLIVQRADGEALAGFGAMGLDAAFWLLAHERDRDALSIADTLAQRLAAGAAPAWHAQLAAASVTVLWRLGRTAEARVIADEAAAAFARHGQPQLQQMLLALAGELADG
jgi:hypothetical protein